MNDAQVVHRSFTMFLFRNASPKSSSNARLVTLAAIANFGIILLFGVLFYRSWKNHYDQARTWSQNVAKFLETSIYEKFDHVNLCLAEISYETENQLRGHRIDGSRISNYIRFQTTQIRDLDYIVIVDEFGNVKYGDRSDLDKTINLSDREYFIKLRDNPNEIYAMSGLLRSRITHAWDIVLARKIYNSQGGFAGAVIAAFNVDYFENLFSNYRLGPNGAIGIRDPEFHLVALHPRSDEPSSRIGSNVVSQLTKDMIRTNPVTATYFTVFARDHKGRLVTFRRISKYPLYVFATISPDEYLYAWKKELAFISVLVTVLIGTTVISVLAIIRNRTTEIAHAAAIRYAKDMDDQNAALNEALSRVKRLEGLISICAYCKKIRNKEQSWEQLEKYISEHSDTRFSHGICPDCAKKYFQEPDKDEGP